MYTSDKFNEIVKPFSSHSHNGAPTALTLKIVDASEVLDGPPIHHVVCQICGKDLTFGKGELKINMGGNPVPA